MGDDEPVWSVPWGAYGGPAERGSNEGVSPGLARGRQFRLTVLLHTECSVCFFGCGQGRFKACTIAIEGNRVSGRVRVDGDPTGLEPGGSSTGRPRVGGRRRQLLGQEPRERTESGRRNELRLDRHQWHHDERRGQCGYPLHGCVAGDSQAHVDGAKRKRKPGIRDEERHRDQQAAAGRLEACMAGRKARQMRSLGARAGFSDVRRCRGSRGTWKAASLAKGALLRRERPELVAQETAFAELVQRDAHGAREPADEWRAWSRTPMTRGTGPRAYRGR